MTIGITYLFFVPPGWILGGTVSAIQDGVLVLQDAVHLEGCAHGHSLLGSISLATDALALRSICPIAWGLPDGTRIREDAILIAVPCARDLRPLARAEDAKAIEEAE